jgi:hypothetical protein
MALSVFATSTTKASLAFVTSINDKKKLDNGLRELIRLSLVTFNQNEERLDMLPLTREYALSELGRYNEKEKIIRTLWIKYFESLRNRSVDPEIGWTVFTDYKPDKKDYKPEIENLLQVLNYCLEVNQEYWRDAAKILDDFRALFFAHGYWNERDLFARKIILIADREGDLEILGRVQRLLAWVQCFRDNYEEGRVFANAALQNSQRGINKRHLTYEEKLPYWQTKYKALTTLGQIERREAKFGSKSPQQFSNARQYFLKAKHIIEKIGFKPEIFICNLHIAQVAYDERKFDIASKLFQSVLQTARNRQNKRAEAQALYYLAKIERRDNKNFSLANWYFNESSKIAVQNDDRPLMAQINFARGQLEEELAMGALDRNMHLVISTELTRQAIKSFDDLGMQNEKKDAERFLSRRLVKN